MKSLASLLASKSTAIGDHQPSRSSCPTEVCQKGNAKPSHWSVYTNLCSRGSCSIHLLPHRLFETPRGGHRPPAASREPSPSLRRWRVAELTSRYRRRRAEKTGNLWFDFHTQDETHWHEEYLFILRKSQGRKVKSLRGKWKDDLFILLIWQPPTRDAWPKLASKAKSVSWSWTNNCPDKNSFLCLIDEWIDWKFCLTQFLDSGGLRYGSARYL